MRNGLNMIIMSVMILLAGMTEEILAKSHDLAEENYSVENQNTEGNSRAIGTFSNFGDLNCEYMFSDTTHHIFISSGYKTANRPSHKGIDIISNSSSYPINGTSIKNIFGGTVIVSKSVTYDSSGQVVNDNNGAGNYVVVQLNAKYTGTNNYIVVRYLHMLKSPYWSVNQAISKGDYVGLAGSTGDSTGPHLHMDVNASGASYTSLENSVNPILFFPNIAFE